jgi:hypothetical protein
MRERERQNRLGSRLTYFKNKIRTTTKIFGKTNIKPACNVNNALKENVVYKTGGGLQMQTTGS